MAQASMTKCSDGALGVQQRSPAHKRRRQASTKMATPQQIDFRVGKTLQAIEHNPSSSIQYLASLVNLSGSRLSHLFKAQTGLTLKGFLIDKRLNRAAFLLRTTEIRIKEITYLSGYSQGPSFDRAFQKKFRCSPSHYRNQQRQPMVPRNSLFG
jgi:transcriptional regulator GlxA family with amidase domain